MTIPFGLASAALLAGRLGHDFLRPLRTWLLLPWIFLTVAIVLGGWWAYEVLGWGGYWAWDPVENASFLPWLTATAALHSAILTERKGILKGWTVTLVLATLPAHDPGHVHDPLRRLQLRPLLHPERDRPDDPRVPGRWRSLFSVALLAAAHRPPRARGRASRTARSRDGDVPGEQPALRAVHLHRARSAPSSRCSWRRSRGVQMSVGRPYFDRMAVPIGVGAAVPDGRGPGAALGRAPPASRSGARCCRRSPAPPCWPPSASRSGVRNAVDAGDAGLRRLHRAGHAARAVAAGAASACARAARASARRSSRRSCGAAAAASAPTSSTPAPWS